jgi:hypothetical protein
MFFLRAFFTLFLTSVSILAMRSLGQVQTAPTRQIEVTEIGTVHSLPSQLLDVLGTVKPGERYTLLARSGPDWYKIDFNGKNGYIPKAIAKLVASKGLLRDATAAGEKVIEPESEATEPIGAVEPREVTAKPEAIEVTAKSGNRTLTWLIAGGVVFLLIIFLLARLERPQESPEEMLHHEKN